MKILIIDNYDSFTYNLYQLAAEITGSEPIVIKNNQMPWDAVRMLSFDAIIVSPGPGRPEREADFGLSKQAILESERPVLGVCLGLQGMCHLFDGAVKHAPEPMHGRLSSIHHEGTGLFADLPNPFSAVRYHSLICVEPLPACLHKTAWTADGLIMGIAHTSRPLWGVQFHPESICTESGRALLRNFTRLAADWTTARASRPSVRECAEPSTSNSSFARTRLNNVPTGDRRIFVRQFRMRAEPVRLFRSLFSQQDAAVWLDSSLKGEGFGRFSIFAGSSESCAEIVGYDASSERVTVQKNGRREQIQGDLFSYLKGELESRQALLTEELPCDFNCGYVGYFGYEIKAACGYRAPHRSSVSDSTLIFADRSIVLDHATDDIYLLFFGKTDQKDEAARWFEQTWSSLNRAADYHPAAPRISPVHFTFSQHRDQYLKSIESCLRYIRDGESYEICLTNRLLASASCDPLDYYCALRASNPAPYAAYLQFPDLAVACSSPERFLTITPDGRVETKPIKGTIRRGSTPGEDCRLKQTLKEDVKNRAENLMIVDLLRNDLGRVCEFGSVHVPKLMEVESYATLHQLITTIRGTLRPGQSAVDCLRCCFPGGSMTGAPKRRTMEILDGLELDARGPYSGTIGYLALNGAADLNIVIRTAVFSKQQVSIGVGGAITALSDPAEEWEEAMLKGKALVNAFGGPDAMVATK